MAATQVVNWIRAGNTWFNCSGGDIKQITLVGDNSGVAHMIYGGGDDYIRLNMGVSDAAAVTALNTALIPTDFTTNVL